MNYFAKLLLIPSMLVLGACVANSTDERPASNLLDGLPKDTVIAANGDIMIPYAEPVDGCKAYKKHEPGRFSIQIVYFHHPNGEFSPTRKGAICE